jgi:hypothetical protein
MTELSEHVPAQRTAADGEPALFSEDAVTENVAWEHVRDDDSADEVGVLAYMAQVAENPLRFLAFLADNLGEQPTIRRVTVLVPEQLAAAFSCIEHARDEIDRLSAVIAAPVALAFPEDGQLEKMIGLYDRGVDVAALWASPARRRSTGAY